jgi:hypothetical protein
VIFSSLKKTLVLRICRLSLHKFHSAIRPLSAITGFEFAETLWPQNTITLKFPGYDKQVTYVDDGLSHFNQHICKRQWKHRCFKGLG